VFDLSGIRVWVRSVDESVEEFHRFPDTEGSSRFLKGFSSSLDVEFDSLLSVLLTIDQLVEPSRVYKDSHVESLG
jgi:hypothetical protein